MTEQELQEMYNRVLPNRPNVLITITSPGDAELFDQDDASYWNWAAFRDIFLSDYSSEEQQEFLLYLVHRHACNVGECMLTNITKITDICLEYCGLISKEHMDDIFACKDDSEAYTCVYRDFALDGKR